MASWVNQEGLLPHPITQTEEIPLMIVGAHIQHFIDNRIKKIVYEELCHVKREFKFLYTKSDEPQTPEPVKEEKIKKPRAPRKKKEPAPEWVEKVKKPRAPRKKKEPVVKKLIVDGESEEEKAEEKTEEKAEEKVAELVKVVEPTKSPANTKQFLLFTDSLSEDE